MNLTHAKQEGTMSVPIKLWEDIMDCLRDRMFICTEDGDQDNDYEVCELLERIERASL